ncbi:MAG: polyprenyl synthetase family protein [Chitinophagales bacterium]
MDTLLKEQKALSSAKLLELFEIQLEKNKINAASEELTGAANHILSTGGKRIRPMLLMHCGQMFGAEAQNLIPAAMAVELYHNSTLIHDDIMDAADVRRGVEATHLRYGINTAINAGNLLTSLAFQSLLKYEGYTYRQLIGQFNEVTIQVIEGQSMDMDFETRKQVTKQEYLKMIAWKTSVLLAASAAMGAIVAGASSENIRKIYDFGLNLGISFQLKDDYLDAFGDMESFGKKRGGDILRNKKTLLLIEAQHRADKADREILMQLENSDDAEQKVKQTLEIFELSGAKSAVESEMENYYNRAVTALEGVSLDLENKQALFGLAESVYNRKY